MTNRVDRAWVLYTRSAVSRHPAWPPDAQTYTSSLDILGPHIFTSYALRCNLRGLRPNGPQNEILRSIQEAVSRPSVGGGQALALTYEPLTTSVAWAWFEYASGRRACSCDGGDQCDSGEHQACRSKLAGPGRSATTTIFATGMVPFESAVRRLTCWPCWSTLTVGCTSRNDQVAAHGPGWREA
jgi:hypothetical protein